MKTQANGIGNYKRKRTPNGLGSYSPESAARMARVAAVNAEMARRQAERVARAQASQEGQGNR